ncbi:hypothetical protein [Chryseobacterium sp. MFBS3-17]|uniref:hypothetical protein n=1 Tax=Chryseobacterium sp. MFBS3-17 TaxID=2886689 RepID=UPI001D0DF72A|nr:hypothetical protein [Chryseobacterium sp. MFBS3-17]MCC2590368.1 hypothetical protein [Chryseobacterium sp. MFBS3-17]
MNRTIAEIKKSITTAFITNASVISIYGLDPNQSFEDQFSMASFENILFDIMALIVWTMEGIFNVHKAETAEMIAQQKVPSLRWYRNLALRFQYGFNLLPESDQFSDSILVGGVEVQATEDHISASKIVKYAAVTKVAGASKISMKIAPEDTDAVFTNDQMTAFGEYIEETQAAGDHIVIVNYLPDVLKINFRIVYDPLVLLSDGVSILTGEEPVKAAVKNFLLNLPFNGELSVQKLEAAVLAVEGVKDLQNLSVQTKWIEPGVGYGAAQAVNISVIPASGRFTMLDDLIGEEDWSGIEYIL